MQHKFHPNRYVPANCMYRLYDDERDEMHYFCRQEVLDKIIAQIDFRRNATINEDISQ